MAEFPPCRSESNATYSQNDSSKGKILQNSEHWIDFYRTLLHKASGFLPLYLRSKIGADDLVQDTMLVASQCRNQTEQRNTEETLSWLIVILKNRTKSAIRNVKATSSHKNGGLREVQASDELWNAVYIDESSINTKFLKHEVIEYMKIAMERIPKAQRNLLEHRFREDRDLRWIAKKLRISERHVRRRVQSALECLKMEFLSVSRK